VKAKKIFIELIMLAGAAYIAYLLLPQRIAVFLNNKAVEHQKSNQLTEAVSLYKNSLKIYPAVQGYYNLACAYEEKGMFEQAIAEYENTLRLDPQYKDAYYAIADIYRRQKKFQKAEAYLREFEYRSDQDTSDPLNEMRSQQVISLYNEAADFYGQGKSIKAISKLKQALALSPAFTQGYKTLGDIYLSQSQLKEAIKYYEQAMALGAKDAVVYNNTGICYMQLEDYERAIHNLKKAYELAPDDMDIIYGLASTFRDNGEIDAALDLYNKLNVMVPEYPNLHNDIADIYENMGKKNLAAAEFKKELNIVKNQARQTPLDGFKRERLAIAYNGLGDSQKAEDIIDAVIRDNPNQRSAYYARAQIYRKLGKFKEAEHDLQRAKQFVSKGQFKEASIKKIKQPPAYKAPPQIKNKQTSFREDIIVHLKNGRSIKGKLKLATKEKIVLEVVVGDSYGTVSLQTKAIKSKESIQR